MNKELAETLTIALVNYIDENRPEGTMDCSSAECKSIEEMFEGECFDIIETFIQKKLSRLTEFEQEVSYIVEYCKEHGENVAFDYAKRHAQTLLALAKKELARQGEVITLDKLPPYDKGFQDGKAEALKDLPRWRRWENGACGNSDNIPVAIVKRGNDYKLVSTLGIQGEQYIMLSNLEKLPGFNDMDCINCPRRTGGGFNTSSGTSAATLHGNTSATDGKEHNPSFTD